MTRDRTPRRRFVGFPAQLTLALLGVFLLSATVGTQFTLPGTQPTTAVGVPASAKIAHAFVPAMGAAPDSCDTCHTTTSDQRARPLTTWMGSMMSQSARDPLFYAQLDFTNSDNTIRPAIAGMADMCLRCHSPKGWLEGRSSALDGLGFIQSDLFGVQCHVCHRLVDPQTPAANPDFPNILSGLTAPGAFGIPPTFGNGMYVMDPKQTRRGPYTGAQIVSHANVVPDTIAWTAVDVVGVTLHPAMNSAFHRSGNLCGTCHDVSNPTDCLAGFTGSDTQKCFPIERTWTEWRHSAFPARGEAGNCQSCHMSGPMNGVGFGAVCEGGLALGHLNDVHFHDLTGGNAFIPAALRDMKQRYDTCTVGTPACDNFKLAVQTLYPTGTAFLSNVDSAALQAGIDRVKRTLRRAALLEVPAVSPTDVTIRVTNRTGHKLPTGYPEGRRMWLNAKFIGPTGALIAEAGRYDDATGALFHDQNLDGATGPKSYDVITYTDAAGTAIAGVGRPTKVWEARIERQGPPSIEFHFALNDHPRMDNRIPPEGWDAAAYTANRADPVIPSIYTMNGWQATYAAGAFADQFTYPRPAGDDRVELTLNYQTASREYIEALRDDNPNTLAAGGFNRGTLLHDVWQRVGRSAPIQMARIVRALVDTDGDGLSDGWEAAHGLTASPDGGFNDDPDGDGLSNWQEFQRGTDPMSAASPGIPAGGRRPVDIVLVLDLSGSMNDPAPGTTTPKVQVLKDAVTLFLETWKDYAITADRIGVVYFRTDAVDYGAPPLLKPFVTERAAIQADVASQTASGWTAMGAGLSHALDGLGPFDPMNPRDRHIILFSNGMQNRSPMVVPDVPEGFPDFLHLRNQTSAENPDVTGGSNVTLPPPGYRNFPLTAGQVVRVHSIGIGVAPNDGGTAWHQMLQNLAVQQGGKHNFVTRASDLEGVFLEDLVQSLRANTVEYVVESERALEPGKPETFEIPVNPSASKMSIVVSWSDTKGAAPAMDLVRPDGRREDLTRITRVGSFYRIVTRFLETSDEAPGEAGVWTLRLTALSRQAPVREGAVAQPSALRVRVHALVDDLDVKYRFSVPVKLRVGDRLHVEAVATERSRLLKLMDRVTVAVSRPVRSIGAALAAGRYSLANPGSIDPDLRSTPFAQKVRAAFADQGFSGRLNPVTESYQLGDLGADGDAGGGDGIFSRDLPVPAVPGHYRFHFTMAGHTETGERFTREETQSVVVRAGPIDAGRSRIRRVRAGGVEYVTLRPVDRAGWVLGPGYTTQVDIRAGGRALAVEDRLDGSYRAPLPAGFAPNDAIAITLDGQRLQNGPVPPLRFIEAMPWWFWLLLVLVIALAILIVIRWRRV